MKLLCCFSESPRTRKKSKNEDNDDDEQSNYMSLDVLAQVASETLQSEPTGKRNAKKVFGFCCYSNLHNSCVQYTICQFPT